MGGIAFEIEMDKLQTQFRLAAHADLVEHVLQVRFDRGCRNTHLKSDLLILVPHAGQEGGFLLTR